MARLKLYILALIARRHDESQEKTTKRFVVKAGGCVARSQEQAVGKGLATAKSFWPREEGWFDHNVEATEIPAELIEMVYSQEVENVSP